MTSLERNWPPELTAKLTAFTSAAGIEYTIPLYVQVITGSCDCYITLIAMQDVVI